MIKTILLVILIVLCTHPSKAMPPGIAGGFGETFVQADLRDVYLFVDDPSAVWSYTETYYWSTPNLDLPGDDTQHSLSLLVGTHGSGIISFEYYVDCSGSCGYTKFAVNGVDASPAAGFDKWATTSLRVASGSTVLIQWIGDNGNTLRIRKALVPKP